MLHSMPDTREYSFYTLKPSAYGKDRSGERVPLYSEKYLQRKNGREWFTWMIQAHVDDLAEDPWTKGPDE